MIRPLRRRHRVMILVLGLISVAVYLVAVTARRPPATTVIPPALLAPPP
jgi:hypothetical protein